MYKQDCLATAILVMQSSVIRVVPMDMVAMVAVMMGATTTDVPFLSEPEGGSSMGTSKPGSTPIRMGGRITTGIRYQYLDPSADVGLLAGQGTRTF